ncbi:hypothetical protein GPECTOR_3g433 [Gonium pectorale]|uniref:Uncharacterized protein n=1 Tax=Gonium pectorale TaxID=33097 RepID=A0A150H095_GONPE|nr:hypothetical protein GPECTOR_3g433 [Gonium pectorale]|eukprot:KXZ55298.1 hypothetical protein GPECTOR_3g433 [Gonium pectorale]
MRPPLLAASAANGEFPAGRGGRGRGRRGSNGGRDGGRSTPQPWDDSPRGVIRKLSKFSNLSPSQADQWVEAALSLLSSGVSEDAEAVLEALGRDDSGVRAYLEDLLERATGEKASELRLHQCLRQLLGMLSVITHDALCGHLTTKTAWLGRIYVAVKQSACLDNMAAGMARLLEGFPSQPPVPSAAGGQGYAGRSGGAQQYQVTSWVEVARVLAALVRELLRRFQALDDRDALREPGEAVLRVAERMLEVGCGSDGGGSGAGGGAKASRVRRDIRNARAALNILPGSGAPSSSAAAVAPKPAAIGPASLPGTLRPLGARHDNDHEDFTRIQIVPTLDELLCPEPPYLPPNRADWVPEHLRTRPAVFARLDSLFRLMRHDAIAPLSSALQNFIAEGGPSAITRVAAGPGRKGSTDARQSALFAYRDVRLEGLGNDFIMVTVQPPSHVTSVKEWWDASKRLVVGTLVALVWEQEVQVAPESTAGRAEQRRGAQQELQLVVGEVLQRPADIGKNGRPRVGIRVTGRQEHLLRQLVTGVASGGGEVMLVQDKNSFFAYRPILAALQAMANDPLPLAEHLLPSCRPAGVERTKPEPPAYDDAHYDLSSLADPSKLDGMGDLEAARRDPAVTWH